MRKSIPLTEDQKSYILEKYSGTPVYEIARDLDMNYYRVMNFLDSRKLKPFTKKQTSSSEDRFEITNGIFRIEQRENWLV